MVYRWCRCVPVVYGDGVSPVLAGAEMAQAVAESLQQASDAEAVATQHPSKELGFPHSSTAATPEVDTLTVRSNGVSGRMAPVATRRAPLASRPLALSSAAAQKWGTGKRDGKGLSVEDVAA